MVALSNVQFGKRNEDVRTIHKALIARGHKLPDGPTGLFGARTKAACRAEQLAQGLTGADADGNPGCTCDLRLLRPRSVFLETGAGLRANKGHMYTYCHLSQRQVRTGQKVSAGKQLGLVGSTGNSTGPHLHFEMSNSSTWSYGNVAKPYW
ncbi:hypothetical protein DMH25_39875 [Streptomyces sp. WAC 01325]|uniref:peptidoglycan DD-metalloendopeptidase family protein n=1 Tax=Streptomyces sp. WAC 01325 TaxID=2203202 RepID=UPI000F86ACD2|nr:peptidoglycan DD-metalloendopeptidase family protein [Streptomyces sp. WAC 01325]RSM89950.1 hypothetical protein DMH25_39875 [Streptomyces sp. WAC 01325]